MESRRVEAVHAPWPGGLPLDLLVLQPTPFCNLDCDYCYLPSRSDRRRMKIETLRRVLQRVLDEHLARPRFTIVWHAGEPLTMPLRWYREASMEIEAARRASGVAISQSVQTNGTLIDADWCAWFLDEDVRVGVSVDGPEWLHDSRRKTRSGRGTWRATMQGITELQRADVPFHVISVLTRDALASPDTLFDFYVDHGISQVGFNIEELEGANRVTSLAADGIRQEFDVFLRRFLERLRQRPQSLSVREFDHAVLAVRSPIGDAANSQSTPGRIVSVDAEGRFSTFSPELLEAVHPTFGRLVFGNVLDTPLSALLTDPRSRSVTSEIARGVRRCSAECDYFGVCGGGAPSNKLAELGCFDATATLHCELGTKAIIDAVVPELERLLGLATAHAVA